MQYQDFDLSLSAAPEGGYRITVLQSPAGEAQETVPFPFDTQALELQLARLENALLKSSRSSRRIPTPEEQAVQTFGQALFDFLLHGEIGRRYEASSALCRQAGHGLRLKLRLEDARLAALPWEFLYDARFDEYVALSPYTPVVRYLALARPAAPLRVSPPLRLLGMVASPANLHRLGVALEKARIERALSQLQAAGVVELTWLEGETWRDLQRAMRRPWHLFHFIGHGGFDTLHDEGYLTFSNAQGQAEPIRASHLAQLLDQQSLRVVVLNACEGAQGGADIFSSTAATLVRRGRPCVVAMQYAITDRAAVEFAHTFYEALAEGLPTERVVSEARTSIALSRDGSLEWGTPVLFTHAPDGVLFDLTAAPARPAQPTSPTPRPAPRLPWRLDGRGRPLIEAWEQLQGVENLPERIVWVKDHKEMALIPAGPFIMGTGEEEARQLAKTFAWDVRWTLAETPQRQVTLANFYLDVAPVTHADYARFLADNPTHRIPHLTETWASLYNWNEKSRRPPEELLDHPVVLVSWEDAAAYARWAGKALPTEEQWEKGARGNDGRTYPWSHTWDSSCLNSAERLAGRELPNATEWRKWWDKEQEALWKQVNTTPVGRYYSGASPYGLVDMAGNVWEWCDAWYAAYPGSQARHDDFGRKYRVVRGGAWNNYRNCARCACRSRYAPHDRGIDVGFRCASTPF